MSRAATVPVSSRMRSASVDLPWSMWAMMLKLRMWSSEVTTANDTGCGRGGRPGAARGERRRRTDGRAAYSAAVGAGAARRRLRMRHTAVSSSSLSTLARPT